MDKNYTYLNDDLLAKYLLGEATMAEIEQVELWANSNPDHLKQLEDFRTILNKSKLEIDDDFDEQEALNKLNLRIKNATKLNHFDYKIILKRVAVFAIIFSLAWLLYQNTIGSNITVNTIDNTLTQVLPDGSTVILNKKSSLSFAGGFFNRSRKVALKGEAFFKVSPDKSKPFIISVNNVKVTVVGTAFNVKGIGKETIVTVESGIVKVNSKKDSVRLTAGEKVAVRDDNLSKGENQGKLYNYYYSNELICDKTPLIELVAVLNQKFNSNIIIVNPSLNTLPISTTFKGESLKEILTIVAETFKLKVEYGSGVIKLK
jgi:transmembrane sensor